MYSIYYGLKWTLVKKNCTCKEMKNNQEWCRFFLDWNKLLYNIEIRIESEWPSVQYLFTIFCPAFTFWRRMLTSNNLTSEIFVFFIILVDIWPQTTYLLGKLDKVLLVSKTIVLKLKLNYIQCTELCEAKLINFNQN